MRKVSSWTFTGWSPTCCKAEPSRTCCQWFVTVTLKISYGIEIKASEMAARLMSCLASCASWCFSPLGLRESPDTPTRSCLLHPLILPHFSLLTLPSVLYLLLLLLLQRSQDNIPPASCLDKLKLRCQPQFWCIPPALASSWPCSPAPTAETFQCFSGAVFTLQQIALLSLSASSQDSGEPLVQSHPNMLELFWRRKRAGQSLGDPQEEALCWRVSIWSFGHGN